MARYYFDVHDGLEVVDHIGRELQDDEAARLDAMKSLTEFVSRPTMLGRRGGAVVVIVRDQHRRELFHLRLVFDLEEK